MATLNFKISLPLNFSKENFVSELSRQGISNDCRILNLTSTEIQFQAVPQIAIRVRKILDLSKNSNFSPSSPSTPVAAPSATDYNVAKEIPFLRNHPLSIPWIDTLVEFREKVKPFTATNSVVYENNNLQNKIVKVITNSKIFAMKQTKFQSSKPFKSTDVNGQFEEVFQNHIEPKISILQSIKGKCPNIVDLQYIWWNLSHCWLLFDWCQNGDLKRYFEQKPDTFDWPFSTYIKLLEDLAIAMEFLHKNNIIHRDIKLENVLYDENSNTLKLTDFDVSKQLSSAEVDSQTLAGTKSYCAPQVLQQKSYSFDADVFSYGITAFWIILGPKAIRNFDAKAKLFSEYNENICQILDTDLLFSYGGAPEALVDLVIRCLRVDPELRPNSKQILAEIRKIKTCCTPQVIENEKVLRIQQLYAIGRNNLEKYVDAISPIATPCSLSNKIKLCEDKGLITDAQRKLFDSLRHKGNQSVHNGQTLLVRASVKNFSTLEKQVREDLKKLDELLQAAKVEDIKSYKYQKYFW